MKKGKEYSDEILKSLNESLLNDDMMIFVYKLNEVFKNLLIHEIDEIKKLRNVQYDNGLIAIFKEQRKKYETIVKHVEKQFPNFMLITDFDDAVKTYYPEIYGWYVENVIES